MIPKEPYMSHGRVTSLEVWCKICTEHKDRTVAGAIKHNLYELRDLRYTPAQIITVLLESLTDPQNQKQWTPAAIKRFTELLDIRFPPKHRTFSGGLKRGASRRK